MTFWNALSKLAAAHRTKLNITKLVEFVLYLFPSTLHHQYFLFQIGSRSLGWRVMLQQKEISTYFTNYSPVQTSIFLGSVPIIFCRISTIYIALLSRGQYNIILFSHFKFFTSSLQVSVMKFTIFGETFNVELMLHAKNT